MCTSDVAWLIRQNAVALHKGDVAMAGKECLIYMKGNPGGTHSFPLTTLPKTMKKNVIIAFYIQFVAFVSLPAIDTAGSQTVRRCENRRNIFAELQQYGCVNCWKFLYQVRWTHSGCQMAFSTFDQTQQCEANHFLKTITAESGSFYTWARAAKGEVQLCIPRSLFSVRKGLVYHVKGALRAWVIR